MRMVRTSAADELCEYCQVSLEFFSNTARWGETDITWGLRGTELSVQIISTISDTTETRDRRLATITWTGPGWRRGTSPSPT